jgi:hypothetical protein
MRRGGKKLSNIFQYFQTFLYIFRKFSHFFHSFQTFSNVFERFLHGLARLVLSQITHLTYFAGSYPQIPDKKAAILFLAITIYCMLPRLPKFTRVVGFGVKNGFFQKAVFDVNKPHSAPKLV